jgi:hypothetical protein
MPINLYLEEVKIAPIHFELKPGARLYHARSFPIQKAFELSTKKEIHRLVDIGLLEANSNSEWASPTFIRPKKTGNVRVLTDFRKLNDTLYWKPFQLPKIANPLQKLEGFKYATALDLSMAYYNVPLDQYSQMLCMMILPWGKFRYLPLPMGIKNSPDIFQNIMQQILGNLEFARVYLDDILITSPGTYEHHMYKVDMVLQRLADAAFRANIKKPFFTRSQLDYLGFWITRIGIQPQPWKVEAILGLEPPEFCAN